MNMNVSKGSKLVTSKLIIILMSLLYVFSPMHEEVNELLHAIVHTLEMPETILTHSKKSDTKSIHKSIEHKSSIDVHDHEIIDFVDRILTGAKNESPEFPIVPKKIDKHIVVKVDFEKNKTLLFKPKQRFIEKEKIVCEGHSSGFKEPPKV